MFESNYTKLLIIVQKIVEIFIKLKDITINSDLST